jgi:Outer membrane protein beta-barrel domain
MMARKLLFVSLFFQCLSLAAEELSSQSPEGAHYAALEGHYLNSTLHSMTAGDAEFGMTSLGFRLGTYIERQVGVELYGIMPSSEDTDVNLDMSEKASYGVLGRFESPESNGGKLFILVGYGASELEMKRSATSLVDRELYHGFVYGGGIELRVGRSATFVNIQGMKYYDEENLSLNGVSLGLRHQF